METSLVREVVEGRRLSIDLSTGPDPFPYPRDFHWAGEDGVPLRNVSGYAWGYPGAVLRNISRTDSGLYSLTAVNYALDNPREEIGRATGSFQLVVLCECPKFPIEQLVLILVMDCENQFIIEF